MSSPLREEGGTVGQVKTVVADDYDSPSSRRTCCSCSVPCGRGDTCHPGDYYTSPAGGRCTRRGIRLCCGASPCAPAQRPRRGCFEHRRAAGGAGGDGGAPASPPALRSTPSLGGAPVQRGSRPLLDDPEQLNSLIHFRSYMGVDLAQLEKYSNLIVVADSGPRRPPEGSAYTYCTFQVLDVAG